MANLTKTVTARYGTMSAEWDRSTGTLRVWLRDADGEIAPQQWQPKQTIEMGDDVSDDDAFALADALETAIADDGSHIGDRLDTTYEQDRVGEIAAIAGTIGVRDDGSGDLGTEIRHHIDQHPLDDDHEVADAVANCVRGSESEHAANTAADTAADAAADAD